MKNYAYYREDGRIFMESASHGGVVDGVFFVEIDANIGIGLTHHVVNGSLELLPSKPSPLFLFNYTTKQWEDPRTLQELKDAQWVKIKQARTKDEYSGFTWDGSTFDSDATSQNRITGAVVLASASPSFSIDWILADNTTRLLSQADMLQVGAALGFHVAAQFSKGVLLRAEIDSATAQSEVDLVMW